MRRMVVVFEGQAEWCAGWWWCLRAKLNGAQDGSGA